MKSIHIRNIDPETLDALKRLATLHHRSLQGELLAILEQAARLAPPPKREPLELHFVESGRRQTLGREEIYDDHR
ncbi:MAG: hypothetical protein HY319_32155 [Armatimonadetes bacterium]|nr:hypothetical protein [Armatimonadota bacterium]